MKFKEDDNLKLIFSVVLAIAFAAYLSNTHAESETVVATENTESVVLISQ